MFEFDTFQVELENLLNQQRKSAIADVNANSCKTRYDYLNAQKQEEILEELKDKFIKTYAHLFTK